MIQTKPSFQVINHIWASNTTICPPNLECLVSLVQRCKEGPKSKKGVHVTLTLLPFGKNLSSVG